MKIKIIRELLVQKGTPSSPSEPIVELLLEMDKELVETYQSETGDYSDPPDQKEMDGWLNSLIEHALEGEDWGDNYG